MTPPRDLDDGGRPLSARLRALAEGIDAPAADLPSGAKGDRVLEISRMIDRLRLEQARAIGAFDADGLWASDGARSVSGWVSARGPMSRGRAAHVARKGRDLRLASAIEEAWEGGRLCEETAFALLAARRVHPVLFDEQVDGLLGWLDGLRVDHALVAIRRWIAIAEETLSAERAEGADGSASADDAPLPDEAAENTTSMHQSFGGRWFLTGDYDAITGAQINERAKAWIDRQFALGAYRADDGLTYPQRMAAAFDALTEAGAVAGQTRHGDPRPSVTVHLDERTLRGEPCEDLDDAMSRRCHLDDGTPVPRATAERFACNARLTLLATAIDSLGQVEVTGITDLLRDATPQQRTALRLRDRGCVLPGCDVPWQWCEVHHLLPWEDGGVTLLENEVLACKHHHHLLHEGGWTLWRASDGRLYLTEPDGTLVPMLEHGQLVDPTAPAPTPPSPAPRRPGELRFLTPRERAARLADRERRTKERDAAKAADANKAKRATGPAEAAARAAVAKVRPPTPGSAGPSSPTPLQAPGAAPPQHGPPSAA